MKYRILHYGEEPLKKVSEPVKVIDNDILINDLGKLGTGVVSAVDTVMTNIASNPSHEIEHFLGTANGKCGNNKITATGKSGSHDLSQLNGIIGRCIMKPVSIGRLDNYIIGVLNEIRILNKRAVAISQVT